MQKYALMFRICSNDQKPSKYAFAYAHMHFQKIRALVMTLTFYTLPPPAAAFKYEWGPAIAVWPLVCVDK
jgi:hypothetical protein